MTALAAIGREAEAERRMRQLARQGRRVREEFVPVWGDDPLSLQYRHLCEAAAERSEQLPVFHHLPFCGGTSMQSSLRLVVPWGRTLQIGRRAGLVEIDRALRMPAAAVDELMLVHQHHPYALTLAGRELRYFTVLRDPVSQIRSGFFKRRIRDNVVATRDGDSSTFAEHAAYTISTGLTNTLARQLVTTHPALRSSYAERFASRRRFRPVAAEEDMFWLAATRDLADEQLLRLCRETLDERFTVVGSMRHLAASHLAATACVGVPVAHRIVHRGRSDQPTADPDDVVDLGLREANAVDQQLYEEYTVRFERDQADLLAAVEQPPVAGPGRRVSPGGDARA